MREFFFRYKTSLIVGFLYTIVTVIFTWPLVFRISSATYGYAGDNLGFIYHLWWWKKATFTPAVNFNFSPLQEAPFGKIINPDSGAFVFYTLAKLFAWMAGEVVGYNLFLLISFPLSGVFTFLLVKEVLGGVNHGSSPASIGQDAKLVGKSILINAIAFWAGLVFAFCPYHLWKSYNHLDLAQIQWFPLYFYTLVRLFKKPSVKTALLAAVSLALVTLTNFYYSYFVFLGSAVFIPLVWVIKIIKKPRSFEKFKILFVSNFLFVFFALLLILPFLKQELLVATGNMPLPSGLAGEAYDRPMDALLLLSARPWSYVLPSVDHPVLGNWSQSVYNKIKSFGSDFKYQSPFVHEGTIFVGWSTLLFAIAGTVLWVAGLLKRLARQVTDYKLRVTDTVQHSGLRGHLWLFPFLATALWLFLVSMPPFVYLAGKNILLPAYFLHRYFPMFRAYSRMGVLVLLCLLVPASFGLFKVFSTLRNYGLGIKKLGVLYFSVIAFSLFEFVNFPPPKLLDLSTPPVYEWLAGQEGDFTIVEYPREFNVAEALLFQRIHGKPVFNPHTGSPYEGIWEDIENIQDPNTPQVLRSLGVKYVLLHDDCTFKGENPVDTLWYTRCYKEPINIHALPEGLRLVKSFEGVEVLEVTS